MSSEIWNYWTLLFVYCSQIQLAKQYLETILSTTIPITINEINSLRCVYPPGITKNQQSLIYGFTILVQHAIWKHRNDVIFQYKTVNICTIITIIQFIQSSHEKYFIQNWYDSLDFSRA